MEKIGVGYAYVSDKEKKYVNEALNSSRLSQGDMVNRFEKNFAKLHDQKYGIACNSGTSALHIALECLAEKYDWDFSRLYNEWDEKLFFVHPVKLSGWKNI